MWKILLPYPRVHSIGGHQNIALRRAAVFKVRDKPPAYFLIANEALVEVDYPLKAPSAECAAA